MGEEAVNLNERISVNHDVRYGVRWTGRNSRRIRRGSAVGSAIRGNRFECQQVADDLEARARRMGFALRYWASETA